MLPMPRSALIALFWIAAVTCVICQLVLIRAVASGGAAAKGRARWQEIAWVVLPALALLGVLVATWHALAVSGSGGIVSRFMS